MNFDSTAVFGGPIKDLTDFYTFRVPEEFYDLTKDRFERANLIAEAFAQRMDRDLVATVLEKVKWNMVENPVPNAARTSPRQIVRDASTHRLRITVRAPFSGWLAKMARRLISETSTPVWLR
jgi:hypothetical protein